MKDLLMKVPSAAKHAAVALPAGCTLSATTSGWAGRFQAMASPCEVLIDGNSVTRAQAQALVALAQAEAQRIEHKFSRYRSGQASSTGNVVNSLHAAGGQPVQVDDETAQLLDFAAHCHAISGGLFDITSGVLRGAWRFDGAAPHRLPDAARVQALLQRVGWSRLRWQYAWLTLPAGMEVDFGGIGKEYAVDRVLGLLRAQTDAPLLVNFGGDLAVSGPRGAGVAWQVGIERPNIEGRGGEQAASEQAASEQQGAKDEPAAAGLVQLAAGALATSGDARRHVLVGGVRYGHVLDPRTGWPVQGAPRSVTVAAGTCTEAGLLSTLALLQGPAARAWLQSLGAPHWVLN